MSTNPEQINPLSPLENHDDEGNENDYEHEGEDGGDQTEDPLENHDDEGNENDYEHEGEDEDEDEDDQTEDPYLELYSDCDMEDEHDKGDVKGNAEKNRITDKEDKKRKEDKKTLKKERIQKKKAIEDEMLKAVESQDAILKLKSIITENEKILSKEKKRMSIFWAIEAFNASGSEFSHPDHDEFSDLEGNPYFIFTAAFNRAAELGKMDVMKFFIEDYLSGNSVILRHLLSCQSYDERAHQWLDPFGYAARAGQFEIFQYLTELDKNIPPDYPYSNNLIYSEETLSWGRYINSLPIIEATRNGHHDIIRYIYEEDPESLEDHNDTGETAFSVAVKAGRLKTLIFLYSLPISPGFNREVVRGATLFTIALHEGHGDIADYLLNINANFPNIASATHFIPRNRCIFYYYRDNDFWENRSRVGQYTPLMAAASGGNIKTFQFLLSLYEESKHPEMLAAKDQNHSNVFMWACYGGHIPMLEKLLELNPDYINQKGLTHEEVKALGIINPRNCFIDYKGFSPLQIAIASNNNLKTIQFLLSNGARIDYGAIYPDRRIDKCTPGYESFYKKTSQFTGFDERMMAQDLCDPRNPNHSPNFELKKYLEEIYQFFDSVVQGNIKTVSSFVRRGFPVNMRDTYNRNLLMLALLHDHVDIALLLVRSGARNMADDNGETPLMLALKRMHEAVVFEAYKMNDQNLKQGNQNKTEDRKYASEIQNNKESKYVSEARKIQPLENAPKTLCEFIKHAEDMGIKLDYEFFAGHEKRYWISFANRWYNEDLTDDALLNGNWTKVQYKHAKKKKGRLAQLILSGDILCKKNEAGNITFEPSSDNNASYQFDEETRKIAIETALKLFAQACDKDLIPTFLELVDLTDYAFIFDSIKDKLLLSHFEVLETLIQVISIKHQNHPVLDVAQRGPSKRFKKMSLSNGGSHSSNTSDSESLSLSLDVVMSDPDESSTVNKPESISEKMYGLEDLDKGDRKRASEYSLQAGLGLGGVSDPSTPQSMDLSDNNSRQSESKSNQDLPTHLPILSSLELSSLIAEKGLENLANEQGDSSFVRALRHSTREVVDYFYELGEKQIAGLSPIEAQQKTQEIKLILQKAIMDARKAGIKLDYRYLAEKVDSSYYQFYIMEWQDKVITPENLIEKSENSGSLAIYKENKDLLSKLIFSGSIKPVMDQMKNISWQVRTSDKLDVLQSSSNVNTALSALGETPEEENLRFKMAMKFALDAGEYKDVISCFMKLLKIDIIDPELLAVTSRCQTFEDAILIIACSIIPYLLRKPALNNNQNSSTQQRSSMDLSGDVPLGSLAPALLGFSPNNPLNDNGRKRKFLQQSSSEVNKPGI